MNKPLADLKDMMDQLKGPIGMVSVEYFKPNYIDAELLKAAIDELAYRYTVRAIAFPPSACERVVAALLKPLCR